MTPVQEWSIDASLDLSTRGVLICLKRELKATMSPSAP